MKRVVKTGAIVDERDVSALSARLPPKSVKVTNTLEGGKVAVWLSVPSDIWPQFRGELEAVDQHVREGDYAERFYREECVFSPREIESAELLRLLDVASPLVREFWKYPVKFDLARSKEAEVRSLPWALQRSPLVFRRSQLERAVRPLRCANGEWVCRRAFFDKLKQSDDLTTRLQGLDVAGPDGKVLDEFVQLASPVRVPRFLPSSTGFVTRSRTASQPDAVHCLGTSLYEGLLPMLSRRALVDTLGALPAVAFTSDFIGTWPEPADVEPGVEPAMPQPWLVVNQIARQLLLEHSKTRLGFVPIALDDDA